MTIQGDKTTEYSSVVVPERVLRAYLLGLVEWEPLLLLQRRLIYELSGSPGHHAVVLCEHPPSITIGREGSREHIRFDWEQLQRRGWPVLWQARGGGVMLHLPGQLACYPMVTLSELSWTPAEYVARLQDLALELLHSYDLAAQVDPRSPGVRVGHRRIAHIGVAIRNGISCFGLLINVDCDLQPFYRVRCDGDEQPMTSLQREIGSRFRVSGVRPRLLHLLQRLLRIDRLSIFHTAPDLLPQRRSHVATNRNK
jgi:lipoyl(octanoyl) transferase